MSIIFFTQVEVSFFPNYFVKFLFHTLFSTINFYTANSFLLFSTSDTETVKGQKQNNRDFKITVLEQNLYQIKVKTMAVTSSLVLVYPSSMGRIWKRFPYLHLQLVFTCTQPVWLLLCTHKIVNLHVCAYLIFFIPLPLKCLCSAFKTWPLGIPM